MVQKQLQRISSELQGSSAERSDKIKSRLIYISEGRIFLPLTNLLRAGLSALCVILILLGGVLQLVPGTKFTNASYSSQRNVCQNSYSTPLTPYQVVQTSCSVLNNYSVVISMTSNLNSVVTVWINETGHSVILYNASGTQFSANFPTLVSGSIQSRIVNPQGRFDQVSGYISVYAPVQTTSAILVTVHPYATVGYGLIGGSGIVLFMLIWNPRKMSTKTLDYLRVKISARFKNNRTRNATNA